MSTSVEGSRRVPSYASSSSSKRRPPLNEFDSLHDLLEQAGYKETRIFTPASIKVPEDGKVKPSRPTSHRGEEHLTDQSDLPHQRSNPTAYPSAAWFTTTFWRPAGKSRQGEDGKHSIDDLSDHQRSILNRKRSEPVLSKKSRKAVQRGWMGMWNSTRQAPNKEEPEEGVASTTEMSNAAPRSFKAAASSSFSPSSLIGNDPEDASSSSKCGKNDEEQIDTCRPPSQSLRHTSSTTNLWQGSLQHHRSYPARLRQQGRVLNKKESYDGARVVAGVGVGSAKAVSTELIFTTRPKERVSLRQAFEQAADFQPMHRSEGRTTTTAAAMPSDTAEQNQDLVWADSVSTLADSEEKSELEIATEEKHQSSPQAINRGVSLFSAAATPLLSRQEAVAMRNVDCLDFAGSVHQSISGGVSSGSEPASRPLRKMRSVDALELALARMETRQQSFRAASSTVYETIPESFSADSLTNEELASGATTTTTLVMMAPEDELRILSNTSPGSEPDPIRRSTTPRLVITSPTGLRSPQELVLEGREYEPRSFSPGVVQTNRPIANRMAGWKGNKAMTPEEQAANDAGRGGRAREIETSNSSSNIPNVPKRSSSKRRSRSIRTRDVLNLDSQATLPIPVAQSKPGKKRATKSCHDLRGAVASSSLIGQMGRLSGSEQIRALKKDVMERSGSTERQKRCSEDEKHRGSSARPAAIPCSPLESDSDDPFSDFAALKKPTISSASHRSQPSHSHAGVERTVSPVPFEPARSRRPLSASSQNHTSDSSSTTKTGHAVLSKKKSGVGIACLIEQENRKSSRPANDENEAPNSLLDSPTAHVVKTRRSRTSLRQN